ncbi:MAG: 30S ribosomal protein S6 [Myxococcales bacterium FL481]|nr:MAG: 30S ribosomal protein S6 [Myxococcales bacterium FL481]
MQQISTTESYRSRQGTQREYECVLVLRPSMNKTAIGELITRFQRIFETNGGRLQAVDNWGVRTLAYPIARHKQGIYVYVRFLGGSAMVQELERNLRIFDEVVRFLTVRVDEDVDPSARPSELTDELLEAATESAPDPVELERARIEAERAAEAERRAAEAAAAAEAADGDREPSEGPVGDDNEQPATPTEEEG